MATQGAQEPDAFAVGEFAYTNGALTLTVPADARGVRALVLTWWIDNYHALFSLYEMMPDGELTRICGNAGRNGQMLEPVYDPQGYVLTAAYNSAQSCYALLLY